ncbi:winged helix DNA-binding domain-containing protein [Arthrobacter sp. CAN_A1]|uniref:winged helix DNA-binding domain-containing protein n=1 Tax=Arthrobacter sp. CAN_A1 TaxID=2787717 RepID=UPI0018CA6FA6
MSGTVGRNRLLQLRLGAQLIRNDGGARPSVRDVVERLLAMQAQDFNQALWAVGLRSPGSTRDEVLAALQRGDIVRSWPMRGTLHFVLPADLRWLLRLTTDRLVAGAAARHRELGLDRATLERARGVALTVLAGGGQLGRNEFLSALNAAGIDTTSQRGYHLIWYLAQTGTLCWGPPAGSQQALVLLDEWVPSGTQPDREEALGRFVLGYFTGHGPATLRDFVWWSKLTVADAKAGLALARSHLTELICNDITYWVATARFEDLPRTSGMVLLPAFDEYVIGYQDRSPVLAPKDAQLIVPGGNGVFRPTVVTNGRVAGTWHRSADRSGGPVANPFESMTARDERAFLEAGRSYERFIGARKSRCQPGPE